jgi:hypothetical protein
LPDAALWHRRHQSAVAALSVAGISLLLQRSASADSSPSGPAATVDAGQIIRDVDHFRLRSQE